MTEQPPPPPPGINIPPPHRLQDSVRKRNPRKIKSILLKKNYLQTILKCHHLPRLLASRNNQWRHHLPRLLASRNNQWRHHLPASWPRGTASGATTSPASWLRGTASGATTPLPPGLDVQPVAPPPPPPPPGFEEQPVAPPPPRLRQWRHHPPCLLASRIKI